MPLRPPLKRYVLCNAPVHQLSRRLVEGRIVVNVLEVSSRTSEDLLDTNSITILVGIFFASHEARLRSITADERIGSQDNITTGAGCVSTRARNANTVVFVDCNTLEDNLRPTE